MLIYFKYFFLFSKLSHYYIYFFWSLDYFLKLNVLFFYNIKNIINNYCNILYFLLKIFKNYFIYYNIKTLPVNSLVVNTQIKSMYIKKNFDNIYLKNLINKDFNLLNFKLNSIFNLLHMYNDFFIFINKKSTLFSFNNLILNLKFNFFLLLINANWNLIVNSTNLFGSLKHNIINVIRSFGAHQYSVYSPTYLWKFWSNYFLLIINISFYNVQILCFSKIYFKKIVDPFNWLMWSLSFFFWKTINKNFFFKYSKKSNSTMKFFKYFKSWFYGLTFILDSNFHYSILQIFNKYNIFNFALLDVNCEPWVSWYPIPGRSSDLTLQYLFLILTFKIRLMGLNLFFFFKFYYLYCLRLLNFFFYINNILLTFLVI
jgi:hypothetical protein